MGTQRVLLIANGKICTTCEYMTKTESLDNESLNAINVIVFCKYENHHEIACK